MVSGDCYEENVFFMVYVRLRGPAVDRRKTEHWPRHARLDKRLRGSGQVNDLFSTKGKF